MAEQIYDPEKHPRRAFKLALLGLTDEEMADHFEVAIQTFDSWKRKHPEFMRELTRGKTEADSRMAHAFYKTGIGYYYEEEEVRIVDHAIQIIKVKKYMPGDRWAQFKWLSNRRRVNWAESQQALAAAAAAAAGSTAGRTRGGLTAAQLPTEVLQMLEAMVLRHMIDVTPLEIPKKEEDGGTDADTE